MPSPKYLNPAFQTYKDPEVFFAGQITGVEGYVESSASGMIAAINMDRVLKGKTVAFFPNVTMLGALSRYISGASKDHFQPMNANFGILPSPEDKMKKDIKRQFYSDRALKAIHSFKEMLYEQ
jgi:methylenetetrahydrofolate--tRNA-(uracil-5-)-methyltransferase